MITKPTSETGVTETRANFVEPEALTSLRSGNAPLAQEETQVETKAEVQEEDEVQKEVAAEEKAQIEKESQVEKEAKVEKEAQVSTEAEVEKTEEEDEVSGLVVARISLCHLTEQSAFSSGNLRDIWSRCFLDRPYPMFCASKEWVCGHQEQALQGELCFPFSSFQAVNDNEADYFFMHSVVHRLLK